MVGEAAMRYGAMVARCKLLGCDRPDLQYAAKEASTWMAKPCQDDRGTIARIGEYVNGGARRMEQLCPFGKDEA